MVLVLLTTASFVVAYSLKIWGISCGHHQTIGRENIYTSKKERGINAVAVHVVIFCCCSQTRWIPFHHEGCRSALGSRLSYSTTTWSVRWIPFIPRPPFFCLSFLRMLSSLPSCAPILVRRSSSSGSRTLLRVFLDDWSCSIEWSW